MSSTTSVPSPKRSGERVEADVLDAVDGLRWVSDREDPHVDAEVTDPIWPGGDLHLGGICVLEPGTRVEIKSASVRLTSGERGRFYVRRKQHESLVDEGGVYVLAVYAPNTHDILAMAAVPATVLGGRLHSWREAGPDRPTYTQLCWASVLSTDIVPGEGGEQ